MVFTHRVKAYDLAIPIPIPIPITVHPGDMGMNFVKQMDHTGMTGGLSLCSDFTLAGSTMPTIEELTAVSPDVPVMVLHF